MPVVVSPSSWRLGSCHWQKEEAQKASSKIGSCNLCGGIQSRVKKEMENAI
jgi:hypothetical protein